MASPEKSNDVPTNSEGLRGAGRKVLWLGWIILFGAIGIVATIGVQYFVSLRCQRDERQRAHASMQEQMNRLRAGEMNCLVNPDPRFIDEVLADAACATAVEDLYLGGDVSDSRLGRLRELPNLKAIIFLFADPPSALLKSLHGMTTIEGLTFEHVDLSRHDMEQIATLPNLKSLCFPQYDLRADDLEPLHRCPSLERLVVTKASPDELTPFLQKARQLRYVGVGVRLLETSGAELTEDSLRKLLPNCECRVWDDER